MILRRLAPFLILIVFIMALFQIGCDTLVTENNTVFLLDSTTAEACFDCHNDENNKLLRPKGQFANSAHANHEYLDVEITGTPCINCHTHEGFLKEFDNQENVSTSVINAINCFTCHLPHTGDYAKWDEKSLRAVDTVSGVTFPNTFGANLGLSNSCAHCHMSTKVVPESEPVGITADFGPHSSPQADIVSGKTGYFHDVTANVDHGHKNNGCINCHYGERLGDGQGYTYAEHTFRLEDDETGQQYTGTCANCHSGTSSPKEVTDFYTDATIQTIDSLAVVVKDLLNSYSLLDPADTSGSTPMEGISVPAIQAQALYNYLLYKHDGSRGIHNINFITNLLDTTKTVLDSLPPVTQFASDINIGCVGATFTFTPSIIGGYNSIEWDFGNDSTLIVINDLPVQFTYDTTGIYTVQMTTNSTWTLDSLNDAGNDTIYEPNVLSDIFSDTVIVDTVPTADFNTPNTTICAGEEVTFSSTSSNLAPGTYKWYFGVGDTVTSSVRDMAYIYNSLGTFDVSMIVTTSCGSDTAVKAGYVTVNGLIPGIDTTSDGSNNYTFTDNTIGTVDSREWDFDNDGNVDATTTPANFTYVADTILSTYWAKLTVNHATCGAYSDSILIIVPAQ